MNDFEEYFKAGEPGRRERAEAWATAIGLQQVDGLVPSQFLFNTAIDHIEGRKAFGQSQGIRPPSPHRPRQRRPLGGGGVKWEDSRAEEFS